MGDFDGNRDQTKCYSCGMDLQPKDGNRVECLDCQINNALHTQVMSKHGFLVDEKLKDLIEHLNDLGIETENSCQDNIEDKAWIEISDYEMFRGLLDYAKDNGVRRLADLHLGTWNWSLVVDDDDDGDDEEDYFVNVSCSWRFPKLEIERLTDVITKWKHDCDNSPKCSGDHCICVHRLKWCPPDHLVPSFQF